MRTVYLGTSEFAVDVLERLAATPHRPVLVVTRPDRPRGRGRKLQPPPVAERAALLGIDTIQPEDLNGEQAQTAIDGGAPRLGRGVRLRGADQGAAAVRARAAQRPPVAAASLARRGADRARDRGRRRGDRRDDHASRSPSSTPGPICLQRAESIAPDDDYGSLAPRLSALGGELLVEALDTEPPFREQSDQGVTYAEKIEPADRLLDPARPADELERRVRALTPHIGAYVELDDGERLGVRRAALVPAAEDVPPGRLDVRDSRVALRGRPGRPRAARGAAARASGRWTRPPGCAAARAEPDPRERVR